MKTHKALLLALIVSAVLSVSAQAGKHHGNDNDSPAPSRPERGNSGSASTSHSGSGLHYGGRPTTAPSQRFSSYGSGMRSTRSAAFRDTSFRQRSFNSGGGAALSQRQFTPRTFGNSSNGLARSENSRRFQTTQSDRFTQLQSDRVNRFQDIQTRRGDRLTQFQNRRAQDLGTTAGAIRNIREDRAGSITTDSRRLTTTGATSRIREDRARLTTTDTRRLSSTNTTSHIYARRSADWQQNWDRSCDHWWRGHRCRFVNNTWIIFDLGFTPWYGYPYDYYASSYYPYGYDAGYYDSGYYDSGYYGQGDYYSSDQYDASTVAAAQEQLARQGYYRGPIDGIFGRGTRRALIRYQSDNGLRVTGDLTSDTLELLGLGRVAAY
jgi:hypothetical protein